MKQTFFLFFVLILISSCTKENHAPDVIDNLGVELRSDCNVADGEYGIWDQDEIQELLDSQPRCEEDFCPEQQFGTYICQVVVQTQCTEYITWDGCITDGEILGFLNSFNTASDEGCGKGSGCLRSSHASIPTPNENGFKVCLDAVFEYCIEEELTPQPPNPCERYVEALDINFSKNNTTGLYEFLLTNNSNTNLIVTIGNQNISIAPGETLTHEVDLAGKPCIEVNIEFSFGKRSCFVGTYCPYE